MVSNAGAGDNLIDNSEKKDVFRPSVMDMESSHYRPWRPNSSFSRGRSDPHHQTFTPDKHVATLSHGRGSSVGYGELGSLSYSRTKLIDIYRMTGMVGFSEYLKAFVQVPSLTQEAPIEPLSVCAPTPEELVVLKGIDKGEIISSGDPQVSKDGSAVRTTDIMQSRRNRIATAAGDSVMRRQSPSAINREIDPPITSHPSPEGLVLCYKDPQGKIQGPFAGSDIITWFESGYFGLDLHVRVAGAPAESPFYLLRDVMPHLCAKARAPPGFNTPKANEAEDTPGVRDESANAVNFVLQDVSQNKGSEKSGIPMYLPHQMFVNTPKQRYWDLSLADQIVEWAKRISGSTDGIDTTSNYDEPGKVSTTDIASSFSAREH